MSVMNKEQMSHELIVDDDIFLSMGAMIRVVIVIVVTYHSDNA